MPSNAFTGHPIQLLADADHIDDAHGQLPVGIPGRPARQAALNRAAVVICVSAWEAYIEELVRASVEALRPAAEQLGVWPALNASARSDAGRFHTPNLENVRALIANTIGLQDVDQSWTWQNCTVAQAAQRLAEAMRLRHQIAHGVNPRPLVSNHYSSQLPEFFRRLGRCTDRAVRDYLVATQGILDPWPA